jgi:hypothetical protein
MAVRIIRKKWYIDIRYNRQDIAINRQRTRELEL